MVDAGILGIIQKTKTPIRVMYDRKNHMDMTFENLPSVPDIKLDEHQYDIIYRMTEERRYFLLEFDIRNHWKPGPIKYHNVIGVIPGTEYPDEYVIMGGHLDSYDVATGGVDDGSGSTPAMEAARLIMEAPSSSIIVMIFVPLASVTPTGEVNRILKSSLPSLKASLLTIIEMLLLRLPAAILSVPLTAVKSSGLTAVLSALA